MVDLHVPQKRNKCLWRKKSLNYRDQCNQLGYTIALADVYENPATYLLNYIT